MELDIIRTLPQWQAIGQAWNDLLERSVVRVPFLRHEFLSAWWRHLGGGGEWPHAELHVVLVREAGSLVAAAPLMSTVDRDGRPIMTWIGSVNRGDYLDVLALPERLPAFIDALLGHLLGPDAPEWRSLELSNLLETSPTPAELRRAAAARGLPSAEIVMEKREVAPLAGDWETFLAEHLEKKDRYELLRKTRRAEKQPGLRWYFSERGEALDADIAHTLRLMEQDPRKSEFLAPPARAQLTDIIRTGFQAGWLRLAFLEIGGERAAVYIVMDFDNRLWIYSTGIDDRFREFSPGAVLLGYLFQWAIAQRRAAIDFLRGLQAFKACFGSEPGRVVRMSIRRSKEVTEGIADDVLAAGLGAAAVLQRGGLPAKSYAACEIVLCRMPDGACRQLFCKFGPMAAAEQSTHRFGVGYEAQVYDQIMSAWPGDVPALHGALLDETTQTVGLALEYFDDATMLHHVTRPKAGLRAAARWIARFHRWGETAAVPSFLHRYDTEFYRHWIERAAHFTRRLHERFPWLPELCRRCQRRLPALLPPATIIHGEYQANNILVCDGRDVPVDWESAALAAGEIDLASLTWGWGDDLASLCEQEYGLARWPDGTPGDFGLRLTAARVFLHLRWLGEADDEDGMTERTVDLQELLPLAERLRELDL